MTYTMSDKPKVMLRGLAASTWVLLHLISYVVLVLAVLVVIVIDLVDNSALRFGNSSASYLWGGFSIVVFLTLAAIIADPVKRRQEVRAGYTTLQNSYQFVEQRDPSTGEVLRAAGSPYVNTETVEGGKKIAATGDNDDARQHRDAAVKHERWWVGPAVLAVVLVAVRIGALSIDLSENINAAVIVTVWLGIILLLIWTPSKVVRARGRARDRFVRQIEPDAMIILATRTDEIMATLRLVRPNASLNTFFIWAVDDDGPRIWQGGRKPVCVAAFKWSEIHAIDMVEYLSERGRTFSGASFSISAAGPPLRMLFLVRSESRRLIPSGQHYVEATVRKVEEIRGTHEGTAPLT